jgi:hypothetical protein
MKRDDAHPSRASFDVTAWIASRRPTSSSLSVTALAPSAATVNRYDRRAGTSSP